MRPIRHRSAALTALAVFGLAAAYGAAGAGPSKSIAWQTDYNKALAAAEKQHKIVMIDFYTEG